MVRVVGRDWDGPTHQLRDLLTRHAIQHGFADAASSRGAALLEAVGTSSDALPVVVLPDGAVMVRPSASQIGAALGLLATAPPETYDLAIVGAGPAGLAAAVNASSEGLRTAVVESEAIGDQAGTSSLIHNYLGFPRGISGSELAQRAYEQAWLFGAQFVYGVAATRLRPDGPLRELELSDGSRLRSRAVVLAMGVSYRQVDNPDLDRFRGAGVFYGAAHLPGCGGHRTGRRRRRRGELRRPGRQLPGRPRPSGDPSGPRRLARRQHVGLPHPHPAPHTEHRDPLSHRSCRCIG